MIHREKVISPDQFSDWIQYLSYRDALIAMLLYFEAPSLEEILNLKIKDIASSSRTVHFPEIKVVVPTPLAIRLKELSEGRNKNDLLFCNRDGQRIERTHLNNAFKRASRMYNKIDITPALLKKYKKIIFKE